MLPEAGRLLLLASLSSQEEVSSTLDSALIACLDVCRAHAYAASCRLTRSQPSRLLVSFRTYVAGTQFECPVCYRDVPFVETYAMGCGHRLCSKDWVDDDGTAVTSCWGWYLQVGRGIEGSRETGRIDRARGTDEGREGNCVRTRALSHGCVLRITCGRFRMVVSSP